MEVRRNLFVMTVLGILALCGPAWATEGPIAHWKFDEGSGTTAHDLVGGNHGTGNCFIAFCSGPQVMTTRICVPNRFIPKNAIQNMLNKGLALS